MNSNRNITTNYELDKTIKHTKAGVGTIKRLSVAVVVNNKKGPVDKDGNAKSVPLSAAEIGQINALVRQAMGYNETRGDTLNIANVSFTVSEKEVVPPTPFWKDPELLSYIREGAKFLLLPLFAYLLWSKMLRPLIANIMDSYAAAKKARELELEEAAIPKVKEMGRAQRGFEAKLAGARDLAKQEPKVVADVIRDWVGVNE